MVKTLYFVVVVAEREGFEPPLPLGTLWYFVVFCCICVPFGTYFYNLCGIMWYSAVSYNGYDNGYNGYFFG